MLRLSRLTDYAVIILSAMAERQGAVLSSTALAEHTNVPEPTVAKVLKLLARDGLVVSIRGAAGGYRLDNPAQAISIGAVVTAIEGPITLTDCVDGGPDCCSLAATCPLHGQWDPVNDAIRNALAGVSIADMTTPNVKVKEARV